MADEISKAKSKNSLLKLLILLLILALLGTYLKKHGYLNFLAGKYEGLKLALLSARIGPDNSESASVKDLGGNVVVDFASCTPDFKRMDLNFGFTSIKVIEKNKNNFCLIRIDGDINNLDEIAKSKKTCLVPDSAGLLSFPKSSDRVDFSAISTFCN